jgi:hypothetical protein
MKNKKVVIATCILITFVAVSFAPIEFWLQTLAFFEKSLLENKRYQSEFNLPNSWFELRPDNFDVSMPEAVIKDFQNSFLDYLNSGGNITQLEAELKVTPGIYHIEIHQVDFSDDGTYEVVICIEFLRRGRHASVIWVAGKIEDTYIITFQREGGWLIYHPHVILIEDINNDELKEVVASTTWIGSDQEIELLVLAQYFPSQHVTTLFTRDLVPLGKTDIEIIDTNGDTVKEILLSGRRWHDNMDEKITYEYKWDGNRYNLVESCLP